MSLVSHEAAGEQLCLEAVGQLLEAGAGLDAALRPAVQLLQDRFPRRWACMVLAYCAALVAPLMAPRACTYTSTALLHCRLPSSHVVPRCGSLRCARMLCMCRPSITAGFLSQLVQDPRQQVRQRTQQVNRAHTHRLRLPSDSVMLC